MKYLNLIPDILFMLSFLYFLYSDYKFKINILNWQKAQDTAILNLFDSLKDSKIRAIVNSTPIKNPEIPLSEKKKFMAHKHMEYIPGLSFERSMELIENGLKSGKITEKDIEYIWQADN